MNVKRHAVVAWLGWMLVACGGSEPANPPKACLEPGSYTEHFKLLLGGTDCAEIADQVVTIGTDGPTVAKSGSALVAEDSDASSCAPHFDANACTFAMSCSATAENVTSTISSSIAYSGNSASGTETVHATDANGEVIADCIYELTITK